MCYTLFSQPSKSLCLVRKRLFILNNFGNRTFIQPICDPVVYRSRRPGGGQPLYRTAGQGLQVVDVVSGNKDDPAPGSERGILEVLLRLQDIPLDVYSEADQGLSSATNNSAMNKGVV